MSSSIFAAMEGPLIIRQNNILELSENKATFFFFFYDSKYIYF